MYGYPECEKECQPAKCSGHGECGTTGNCDCDKPYGGETCEEECVACTLWGDPHVVPFEPLKKFDFHKTPGPYVLFERMADPGQPQLDDGRDFKVLAYTSICRGGVMACIEKAVLVGPNGWEVEIKVPNDQWYYAEGGARYDARQDKLPKEFSSKAKLLSASQGVSPIGLPGKTVEFKFELPAGTGARASGASGITITQDPTWQVPWINVNISIARRSATGAG